MNISTKYAFTAILNAALAVFVCSLLFGWADFVDKLGGAKSIVGLIAFILLGLVLIAGILYLQLRDYEGQNAALIRDLVIAALAVMILGGIGYSWLDLPNGAGLKVLTCIIAVAVVSGLEVWINRRNEA